VQIQLAPHYSAEIGKQRRVAPILILIGLLCIVMCGFAGQTSLRLQREGMSASGVVVALKRHRAGNNGYVESAVVRFAVANGGTTVQFQDRSGSNPPMYQVGQEVRVRYLESSPATSAIIDHGAWNLVPAFVLGSFGLLFTAIGVSLLRSQRIAGRIAPGMATAPDALAAGAAASRPDGRSPAASAPPAALAAQAIDAQPWQYQRRWGLILFAIAAVLLFAPGPPKTGDAALGGFLCILAVVLAALAVIVNAAASFVLAGLRAAAAVRGGASRGMDVGDSMSAWTARADDSPRLQTLLLRYAHLRIGLWTTMMVILFIGVGLMAAQQFMYLLGKLH